MKQVISEKTTQDIPIIKSTQINTTNIYILESNATKDCYEYWYLRFEIGGGWIFRNIFDSCIGFTGFHKTSIECIDSALSIMKLGTCECYEFNTLIDAMDWIKQQKEKKNKRPPMDYSWAL